MTSPEVIGLLVFRRGRRQSAGAGDGEFFILLRTGGATDAYRADDFPINDDRNAALERCEIVESGHGGTPFIDHIFEELGRPFEQHRSPRLADRNVGAGSKSIVEPLDRNEIASFVDDGNGSARSILAFRFGDSSRNHFFRAVQSQPFFLNRLRRSARRKCEYRQYSECTYDELHRLSSIYPDLFCLPLRCSTQEKRCVKRRGAIRPTQWRR